MTFIKNIQGARITGSITASFAGDGSGLTGIISASNADTASYVDLVAGTNITINQAGTTYTINSTGGGGSAFPYTGSAIISGSLEVTGSVNISGSLIASGLSYPTADQEPGDVLTTDGLGNLSFNKPTIYAKVKNITADTLPKGIPVHVTSSVGNVNEVVVASASNAATMPATFILAEQLTAGQEGLGIVIGFINGVDTSTFTEGEVVYVAADGGYTNVKPTGSSLIQNIGIVTKIDASNGSGFIYGSGRSNDVPNITEGYTWVGNSNGVATPTATSSIQNVVSSSYAATASYAGLYSGNGTIPLNTTASVNGDLLFQGLDEDTKLIVRDGNNGSSIELFSDGNAGQASIRFVDPSDQLVHQIQQAEGETRYISNNRDLIFTTSTSSLTRGIVVQAGTGNVGVGSDATTDKLSVLGSFNLREYGSITIPSGSAGWYRLGYTSGGDRGGIRVVISYIGSNWTPVTFVINAFKNWAAVSSLSLEKYGASNYISEARIVQDEIDSTTYHLEINLLTLVGDGTNGHIARVYFDKNLGYEGTWNLNTGSLSASTSVATPVARSPFILTNGGYTLENLIINDNVSNQYWKFEDATGSLQINDWNSDNLITLDGVNNRVGIGTDTPNDILEVTDGTTIFATNLDNPSGPLISVVTTDTDNLIRFGATDGISSINIGTVGTTYSGVQSFGVPSDSYIYSNSTANGLNIINGAGTSTDDYIRLYAGINALSTSHLHIQGSGSTKGFIGIGTDTPNDILEVVQNTEKFRLDLDESTGPEVVLSTPQTDKYSRLLISDGVNILTMGTLGFDWTGSTVYGNPGDSSIYSNTSANGVNIISAPGTGTEDYIRLYAGGNPFTSTASLHIHGSGSTKGFIGIGTENPGTRLHIYDSVSNSVLTLESGDARVNLRLRDSLSSNVPLVGADSDILTFGHISGGDKMIITPTGDVGIGELFAPTIASGKPNPDAKLHVVGASAGTTVFKVDGTAGELFSVTDSLSGSLFSVNDISGLPILEVFSDNTTLIGSYQDPMLITTTKLVTTASGAFTIYSLPTASYDTAFYEYSIHSGSNARAGSIIAIQSGSSVNFTETTTTDFGSTSTFAFTVLVSASNMILTGSATTSGWTIKTIIRGI